MHRKSGPKRHVEHFFSMGQKSERSKAVEEQLVGKVMQSYRWRLQSCKALNQKHAVLPKKFNRIENPEISFFSCKMFVHGPK